MIFKIISSFMLFLLLGSNVYTQDSVKQFMIKNFSQQENTSDKKQYYIYFLDYSHLNTCVSQRMNVIMNMYKAMDKKSIHCIILSGVEEIEKPFINNVYDIFLTSNIYIDDREIANKLFVPNCDAELIVYDSNFKEKYRDCGFNNNQIISNSQLSKIDELQTVSLQEDKSYPIIDIKDAYFDKENKLVYLIDDFSNIIFIYNAIDGNILYKLKMDSTIENYFSNHISLDSNKTNILNMLQRQKLIYPIFDSFVIDKKTNVIYVMAQIFRTIDQKEEGNYDPKLDYVLVEILKDRFGKIREIFTPEKSSKTGKILINNNQIIIETFENVSPDLDSNPNILILQDLDNKIVPLLTLQDILKQSYSTYFDKFFDSKLDVDDEGSLVFIKPKSDIFIFKKDLQNTELIKCKPAGELENIFNTFKINSYIESNFSKKLIISNTTKVSKVIFKNNTVYIYITKSNLNKTNSYTLQAYNDKGFLFEKSISFEIKNDGLLKSVFLDINGNTLYFINKWSNSRWLLQTKIFD